MALRDHVRLIEQGSDVWNAWREANPESIPDLRGLQWPGAKLSGLNLRNARLDGVEFENAKLYMIDLAKAELPGANFRYSEIHNCDLSKADLTGAHLEEAQFLACNLLETVLRQAVIDGAGFEACDLGLSNFDRTYFCETRLLDTNLGGAKALESTYHDGPSSIDHRTLTLSGRLPSVFLRNCGLSEIYIDYIPSLFLESPLYSCFISYSHADSQFSHKLYESLQERGVRCWLDEKHLKPGDDISEEVDRGIRRRDKVLLCCSEASLKSWWVDNEIGMTVEEEQRLTKERGEKVRKLIPLNLDDFLFSDEWSSGYASQIRRRLAADFTGWATDRRKYDREIEKVVQALSTDPSS